MKQMLRNQTLVIDAFHHMWQLTGQKAQSLCAVWPFWICRQVLKHYDDSLTQVSAHSAAQTCAGKARWFSHTSWRNLAWPHSSLAAENTALKRKTTQNAFLKNFSSCLLTFSLVARAERCLPLSSCALPHMIPQVPIFGIWIFVGHPDRFLLHRCPQCPHPPTSLSASASYPCLCLDLYSYHQMYWHRQVFPLGGGWDCIRASWPHAVGRRSTRIARRSVTLWTLCYSDPHLRHWALVRLCSNSHWPAFCSHIASAGSNGRNRLFLSRLTAFATIPLLAFSTCKSTWSSRARALAVKTHKTNQTFRNSAQNNGLRSKRAKQKTFRIKAPNCPKQRRLGLELRFQWFLGQITVSAFFWPELVGHVI